MKSTNPTPAQDFMGCDESVWGSLFGDSQAAQWTDEDLAQTSEDLPGEPAMVAGMPGEWWPIYQPWLAKDNLVVITYGFCGEDNKYHATLIPYPKATPPGDWPMPDFIGISYAHVKKVALELYESAKQPPHIDSFMAVDFQKFTDTGRPTQDQQFLDTVKSDLETKGFSGPHNMVLRNK